MLAAMERNFLKYIWVHTRYVQIWMALVIAISMPLYFISLDLPKRIINGPIDGSGFDGVEDTERFLQIVVPFAEFFIGEQVVIFSGLELGRIPLLIALSALFFLVVIINGCIKLYLNTLKGKTSERVLRRLRYEMFDRVLRFPVWQARQVKPSEVAGIIKDEVDLLSDFIGESYSTPLFQSGQAGTGLVFLFLQNIWFGLLTLAIIILQIVIIPVLRRRLIELGRLRQVTARAMAGSIGEIIVGIDDIHLNDTSNYARASLTHQLGNIFSIRLELFKRKFSVKFLNNLLMQFLSVLFYLIGGYLVITGGLDLGALVASIAAYKDLPGPIRALIDWDQQRQMAQVRFAQAIEGFLRDDLAPANQQAQDRAVRFSTGFETKNLGLQGEGTTPVLEAVSVQFGVNETVAVISEPPEASVRLLELLARLRKPTAGRIILDHMELHSLPEAATGTRVGYADSKAFLPSGTIREILLEVLKNPPLKAAPAEKSSEAISEARRVGNFPYEYLADWIDYDRISIRDQVSLLGHIRFVTRCAGLHEDICDLGMNSRVAPGSTAALASKIVTARTRLRDLLASYELESYVEPFDRTRYNTQASIAENILFGMPVDPAFSVQALPKNPIIMDLLQKSQLKDPLFGLGIKIAKTFSEMFESVSSDSSLFETVTGLTPERIAVLREIVTRIEQGAAPDQRAEGELIGLAMNYVEPRDRFGLMEESLMEKILQVRRLLREALEKRATMPVIFHDFDTYNPSLTITENILFGRIETNLVGGRARITNAVREVLTELELWDSAFEAGLACEVGAGAKSLSDGQQQKMRLARALMKKPDILILNRACAALPGREQRTILETVLTKARNVADQRPAIICAPTDPEQAVLFERVLVLEQGRLVADGPPAQLLEAESQFAKLVNR
jgi:putative ABC transport system ATP-binding protein